MSILLLLHAVTITANDLRHDHVNPVRVRTHTFATLTETEALRLQGRPARFSVEPDSDPGEYGGQVLYDCAGQEPLHRTVWFRKEVDAELMEVEAVLVVIRHKESNGFAAFTELRLTRARVVW